MSEKTKKDKRLVRVGELIRSKRIALGKPYESRNYFVEDRSENLFHYEDWISTRYLASLELGNNQMSLDKLIQLAYALEVDPVEFFNEILKIYQTS